MRCKTVGLVLIFVLGCVPILASADAQQAKGVFRIGFLKLTYMVSGSAFDEVVRQHLRELGYIEGQNIVIEAHSAEHRAQLVELAADLVRLPVDVIVAVGPAATRAARATGTVPIVFSFSGDPVAADLVDSFARPGGNITGITWLAFELVGKRLELLKEAMPEVSRVAVLANPTHPGEQRELQETQHAARALGITLQYHQVRAPDDFDAAFAVRHRLPSVFAWKEYVEAGGLMAYGPNRMETFRRVAVYVDKILKGAKPLDLPVELPSKFELIINLKTAQELGLTIPPILLFRADKVIR